MKNDQGVEEVEENFDEAVKNANNVLVNTKVWENKSGATFYKNLIPLQIYKNCKAVWQDLA